MSMCEGGGETWKICEAIRGSFSAKREWDLFTAILEVLQTYEDGVNTMTAIGKKGIPLHCYIDSGVRHYLKFLRGDKDEPHDRAFVWNMLGAIWTHENKPELIDLPFVLDGRVVP